MYLLDTDIISASRRPERVAASVVTWFDQTPDFDMSISSITVFELQYGALLRRRGDEVQGAMLIDWIRRLVLPAFAGRIIAYDSSIALRCAALHVPDRPERDAMIAATALEHSLTVVTRNTADFVPMGVPVFNPWAGQETHTP
jgi:predicted nucleic acid-binding protein